GSSERVQEKKPQRLELEGGPPRHLDGELGDWSSRGVHLDPLVRDLRNWGMRQQQQLEASIEHWCSETVWNKALVFRSSKEQALTLRWCGLLDSKQNIWL
ncbi:hypothetical protein CHARACLAT_015286, partial [Characodon lateralis]|nr:hypothetical protein [Characodon lateralis]